MVNCCWKGQVRYLAVDQSGTSTEAGDTEQDEWNSDDNNDEYESEKRYSEALLSTKASVRHVLIAGIAYAFFHTNRMSIYLLYAQEFNPTTLQISALLFGHKIWNFFGILYGALATAYGYDKILIFLLLLQCIAVLLESIAPNFYVLFIGILIGQVAINIVVMGYIAWILPEKNAKTYLSYFYAVWGITYLLGPLLAGFVSYYISKRMVFVGNFFVCLITFVHSLLFILGKQKKVQNMQLDVMIVEEKDESEQFPICLERENGNVSRTKWYNLPQMNRVDATILICILIINSFVNVGESVFVLYYSLYIIQEMGGNVILGTAGLFVLSFSFTISSLLSPKLFDNHYKLWTLLIALSLMLLHLFYLYPTVRSMNLYWLLDISTGLLLGTWAMVSEMIQIEIQPKKYSGTISGLKGLLRSFEAAVAVMGISVWWDLNYDSCFYVVGIGCAISWLLTMLVIILKKWKQ